MSEKLHANTFWMGRGGTITHTISGIDIAMWDILGKATGQPVGRLLGGCYRNRVLPYASVLMRDPKAVAEQLIEIREQGFRAFKIGWGPFGRQSDAVDERIVRAARESVGPEALLIVDAGASDAFWHQTFQVGGPHGAHVSRVGRPIGLRSHCLLTICRIMCYYAKTRPCPSQAAKFLLGGSPFVN